jgi:hypothetical protein
MAEIYMVIGFLLAAYSIVGNDSIQTLGTFLYSNSHRKWWILWLYSSSIMVGVILFGYFSYDGDPSYNRLNKVYDKSVPIVEAQAAISLAKDAMGSEPEQPRVLAELAALEAQLTATKTVFVEDPNGLQPELEALAIALDPILAELEQDSVPNPQKVALKNVIAELNSVFEQMEERGDVSNFINWTHLLPPLALLFLTRFGFPVSTSFLVLVTFQPAVLSSMLTKSLLGYLVAFIAALVVYFAVMRALESRWRKEGEGTIKPHWVIFQWSSTAFLWSMWLIQDMANIFVYLPRYPELPWLLFAIAWMVGVQAIIYYSKGGKIQRVVTSKTNTHDIRSATIVDLIYGIVLFIFKVQSNVPMSTTWVFLGLLAGRELAFAISASEEKNISKAFKLAWKDVVKAGFGLGVSVAIAFLINKID